MACRQSLTLFFTAFKLHLLLLTGAEVVQELKQEALGLSLKAARLPVPGWQDTPREAGLWWGWEELRWKGKDWQNLQGEEGLVWQDSQGEAGLGWQYERGEAGMGLQNLMGAADLVSRRL